MPQETSEGNEANTANSFEDIHDFTQALIERSRLLHEAESTTSTSQKSAKYYESDSESVPSTRSVRASSRTQMVIADSLNEDRAIERIFTNINNVAVRVGKLYSVLIWDCLL